jgi:mevalonate pyrophosphate decarboxylase
MKSGSLNLLEPSEPVQACNGIAFTVDGGQSVKVLSENAREENTGVSNTGTRIESCRDFKQT